MSILKAPGNSVNMFICQRTYIFYYYEFTTLNVHSIKHIAYNHTVWPLSLPLSPSHLHCAHVPRRPRRVPRPFRVDDGEWVKDIGGPAVGTGDDGEGDQQIDDLGLRRVM